MEELIKKSDAIKAIKDNSFLGDDYIEINGYGAIEDIRTLPSADRPQGEWIEDARTYYETLNAKGYFVDQYTPYFTDDIACPNCLAKFSTIINETERFDYCPHCGARMKGADDE